MEKLKRIIDKKLPNKNTVDYIRSIWFSLFQSEGYSLIEASSLIPKNDSSLLWINSGVSALKEYFKNPDKFSSKNLVNCQRVIRTNDLNRIDSFSYHQTLFEMLGCFSIGGNFKKEIIPLIWNFFVGIDFLKINPQKLFITVLESDLETYKIWNEQPNIFSENIITADRSTNFWDMGDGPCGPNTEIYYCFEDKYDGAKVSLNDLESKNFIEIINIVFSEFYHCSDKFIPLSQRCVDVGGGLERIALVLQNVKNTFQIDIWVEPINWLEKCYKKSIFSNLENDRWMLYTIADHLRTLIFAISDGASIDHKKQGYVLKKLLKRTALFSYILKINISKILILCDRIIDSNDYFYSNLFSKSIKTRKIIEKELRKFYTNFGIYAKKIKKYLDKNKQKEISAEIIFFWYDTNGFPLELIKFFLNENGITFSEEDFNLILKKHKQKSLNDRKKQNISAFSK
jgi:alanyl-tRNA synthetase